MKLYWKVYFEKVSNSEILRRLHNPIRQYESEMIHGVVVDIGCGQSPFLLDFATTDKKLIAIDDEQLQLDYLKKRVEREKLANLENWNFLNQSFPKAGLPDLTYSLMIFSDFLHFFTLSECVKIGILISQKSSQGTLIYIGVHSDKHYLNNPKDPDNNIYFKHYFTFTDLENVFPNNLFEQVYYAEIDKVDPKVERDIAEEWADRSLKGEGITNPKEIEEIKADYFKNMSQSNIIAIFRRK